ncbi:sodium:proton symporter [Verrucomicrobia bacterium LW23]|nr:sodium:proton symporter [Verrucomicrobia bacterium LW23]
MRVIFSNMGSTILLLAAILAGSLLGWSSSATGTQLAGYVDPLILALVAVLFFEVDFTDFAALRNVGGHWKCLALSWACNFLIIPLLGWGIASLLLSGQPLLLTGLLIYFMAPCTDWFLGFTRLARGNTALGSVLLPINMVSQLLLYPVYLGLLAGHSSGAGVITIGATLWQWFLVPFVGAVAGHFVLRAALPAVWFARLRELAGRLVPVLIAAMVICIFAANISVILEHALAFLLILLAVFAFFVVTYYLAEAAAWLGRLDYPERVLLTMTTAARNAPLMLGITMAALPDQPLIYAALVIGMLVEFPHLTALKHLLLRRPDAPPPAPGLPVAGEASRAHPPGSVEAIA